VDRKLSRAYVLGYGPKADGQGFWKSLRDNSQTLTLIAASVTTAFVGWYTLGMNARQNASTRANLRQQAVENLNTPDDTKREIAALGLAQHGADVLPSLDVLLGIQNENVRLGGIKLAELMLRTHTVEEQELVENTLCRDVRAPDPYLRRGALDALTSAFPLLSSHSRDKVFQAVTDLLNSSEEKRDPDVAASAMHLLRKLSFVRAKPLVVKMLADPSQDNSAKTAILLTLDDWVLDLNCDELADLKQNILMWVNFPPELQGRQKDNLDHVQMKLAASKCP
jgi:hypothetical protein